MSSIFWRVSKYFDHFERYVTAVNESFCDTPVSQVLIPNSTLKSKVTNDTITNQSDNTHKACRQGDSLHRQSAPKLVHFANPARPVEALSDNMDDGGLLKPPFMPLQRWYDVNIPFT